nr:MAG TPA: hypothetical protein [Caudoviricetes sp.]
MNLASDVTVRGFFILSGASRRALCTEPDLTLSMGSNRA